MTHPHTSRLRALATAALLSLAACAAAGPAAVAPGPEPDIPAIDEVVGDHERLQLQEISEYDGATADDDRCERLCGHLDAICAIGGRSCSLAESSPGKPNAAACARARARCTAAHERLPSECVVCGGGE